MSLIKTYARNNEARITCPIFNAETKITDCFALEQKLARGDVQPERRGCQACIRACKCPVYWINRDIRQNGEDLYHASEPRTLSLKDKHLSAIRPILVRGETMDQLQVPQEEREAILAANEAVSTNAKARASRKSVHLSEVSREDAPRPRAGKPAEPDDVTAAAMSGDMSAAVTRAAQAAPAPAPAPAAPVKPAPVPAAVKPAPAPKPEVLAPAGKPMSLLELARQRAAQKAA